MSILIAPSGYFPGITYTASGIHIPYSGFQGFSSGELSDDIRLITYGFLETLASKYSSLDSTDQPKKMLVDRSSNFSSTTNINNIYTILFKLTANTSISGVSIE